MSPLKPIAVALKASEGHTSVLQTDEAACGLVDCQEGIVMLLTRPRPAIPGSDRWLRAGRSLISGLSSGTRD
jgi:hypothetical protein